MHRSLSRTLYHELTGIVQRHLEELSLYVSIPVEDAPVPDDILFCLERLADICQETPSEIAVEVLQEACESQVRVESFLMLMNQPDNAEFHQTEIWGILQQSRAWYQTVAELNQDRLAVWDAIAPVKPDHLETLGNGVYEALWWMPIPWMDIHLLRNTAGVMILNENENVKELPDGISVRFLLLPLFHENPDR